MLRIKLLILALMISGFSLMADDPAVQLINLSPDPVMEVVKVEYGDSVLMDSLKFNEASAYLSVPASAAASLTFTSLADTLESFELSALALVDGNLFQSILFGVVDTNDYATNPDGKSMALNAAWNAVDTSGISSGNVRTNFFHAVSDAVEMDVADFLFEYIVDDMAYGEYSSQSTDLPATLRNLFFLSTDSVTQIASRSADLSAVSGNTVTIFLSGFIVPNDNNNGPVLSFKLVDGSGTVTTLGFVLPVIDNILFDEITVFPNPASEFVRIELYSETNMEIVLSLVDLSGREVMVQQQKLVSGQNSLDLELPSLSKGLYFIRLSNVNGQTVNPLVIR